ncbi:MAG: 2-oxoacid:acceptor oxidoreductase subunit alpha [Dehalococcoidia bacterium]
MNLNIMVGGEAGQGVQSIGFLLAQIFARGGYHVFADQDYESRVRGGHNFYRIRVSEIEIGAIHEKLDILIAMNEESVDLHQGELAPGGVLIFDSEKARGFEEGSSLGIPIDKLARDVAGNKLTANTVALGATLGLVRYDREIVISVLKKHFGTGDIGEANLKAAEAGYRYAVDQFKGAFNRQLSPISGERRMLINGNEAIALGAIAAGCTFVAAYPMTPATTIMEYLAARADDLGMVVIQPEDEIAAVHMAIGASFAGSRAMTATSGGGFCLMVEGIGLAGMTETPVVIVESQRAGPAIGLPTRTEQSDLQFAIHASHGDFPRAVLAPADIEDCFRLTVKAFNLAEKYQIPVILLTDHNLSSSYSTLQKFDLSEVKIERGQMLTEEDLKGVMEYKRYRITPSGISPRAVPGGSALVVADSDAHGEDGHIIEDAQTRTNQMLKRMRKLEGLRQEIGSPRVYGPAKAEITLVGWGSTWGALRETVDTLRSEGLDINHLHLAEIWPFPAEAVSRILSESRRIFIVENNASGQMAELIRSQTGIKESGNIRKFDGRPFTPQIIIEHLRKEIKV